MILALILALALPVSTLAVGPEIPSLVGVDPDGAVRVDSSGDLAVDCATRQFFDHFLSARGEVDDTVLVQRVRAELAQRLPTSAAAEASQLFDEYLRYFELAQRALPQRAGDAVQAFEALRKIRVKALGASVAGAFFGEDEAREAAVLRLRAEKGLDPASAQRALEALYPAAELEARNAAMRPLETRRLVANLRADGAGKGEIFDARATHLGHAAAERLAHLDRQRAAWNARMETYRAELATLTADKSLDTAGKDAAVRTLRAERFTEPEQRRVAALDRIAGVHE